MATNCFGSYKAKMHRVLRLDDCGAPVVGAKSVVASKGFVKITLTPTYEDGQEFIQKNADGDFCINEKDDPRLKRVNAAIDFCKVDPDEVEIMLGTRLLLDGTDAVGFAVNENDSAGRFSLEGWSAVPGSGACDGGDPQFVYWLVPNLGNGQINGDIVLENGVVTFSMKAESKGTFDDIWDEAGPLPFAVSHLPPTMALVEGDHLSVNVTTTAPPTAACGATAYAVPV